MPIKSAVLSNPEASEKTASLYSYLCDTYGHFIISGQQESTWMDSEDYEFDIIKKVSGRLPAIRGLDFMDDDFDGCVRRAAEWYKKGGIVTICWHCGYDFSGNHSHCISSTLDWEKALTVGTDEYDNLITGMDRGAEALARLRDADIPVIWRPFHEFDGKWFWWGKGGADNFIRLWRLMHERYTHHHHLNNLIWCLGYCGDVNSGWYPGDEYVDVVGADTYVGHRGSLADMFRKTAALSEKPVCLHENGTLPDPDNIKTDGAGWLWFMTWHTNFIDSDSTNPPSYIDRVYNNSYVITLERLPDVYNYCKTN